MSEQKAKEPATNGKMDQSWLDKLHEPPSPERLAVAKKRREAQAAKAK